MDIECKLKREGGSFVELGKNTYHFAPREDGAHVATVAIEAHQERLLSIPEAYKPYLKGAKPVAAPVSAPVQAPTEQPVAQVDVEILLGSSEHPASFDINGKTYQLGDVVAIAHLQSGLEADQWNALSDEDRADLIDAQLDKLAADTNGDGEVDNAEERAALVKEYEAKFNKKPNGRMSIAKIREALAAE
jgi:hypothetical protein